MSSCTCQSCQGACKRKPGWFKPGEVEAVAAFMGLTLPELFAKHLAADWWEDSEPTFVLSPGIIRFGEPHVGTEMPGNPLGQCVFYKDGRCSIHKVKPFECRAYHHELTHEQVKTNHRAAFEAWAMPEHQKQIADLLGREPVAESYSIFDSFMWR
jgi:Fe-S-cluster containining protein